MEAEADTEDMDMEAEADTEDMDMVDIFVVDMVTDIIHIALI
jgi:hypothetical protein